jgi:ATP-dependent protease Clp ATPase subunit
VSGAFDGLEKIIRRRIREATIGFAAKGRELDESAALEHGQTRDFIDFGFEPEFIGRLPVRVVCHALETEDLYNILKNSEGSIIRQYEQTFGAYGIDVLFHDEGLLKIAELASQEQTGARGLMTVCERIFRNFKYELPSTDIKQFEVTRELVEHPDQALAQLIAQVKREGRGVSRRLVHEFDQRFYDAHKIRLRFTEDAADLISLLAEQKGVPVRDLCQDRFKDYQFGLKLIAQNSGQQEFVVDPAAVHEPDKTLSEWVVASYKPEETPEASASAQ